MSPKRKRGGTVEDLFAHYVGSGRLGEGQQGDARRIIRLLAAVWGPDQALRSVALRSYAEAETTIETLLRAQCASREITEGRAASLRTALRHLLATAREILGEAELTELPYCALPAEPLRRLRAQTVGDWFDRYRTSGDCPDSVRANMKGVFRRFAQLAGGKEDPHQVMLREAGGLWKRWQEDLIAREARGELRADSVARYKSWGYRAICWAVDNLARLDRHTDLSLLLELTPDMHAALRWLQEHRNKTERQKVRQFFAWLDAQGMGLEALADEGTALTQRFIEEVLEVGGVQTWRQSYRSMCRGLRHLQQEELIPCFQPYGLSVSHDAYSLPWKEIPHDRLRAQAATYYRVACDEQAFDERRGPVVRETTRDQRLGLLGRYIGFLVGVQEIDLSSLSIEEVFARDLLRAYVDFLRQRQDGRTTGGLEGVLHQLKQMAVAVLGLDTEVFAGLTDPKRVEHRSKGEQVPTLDEYHALIDQIGHVLRQPGSQRTSTRRASLARLYAMLVLLGDCPLRIHTLRHLELAHLERDPLSGQMALALPADLLKSKRPFRYPLSPEGQVVLEHYIERERPELCKGESTYLFPTRSGKAIAATAFNKQLALWDSQVRGVPLAQAISPHRIRDMVSRTCMTYLPEKGGLVASTLLQHAGLKTLDRHYLDEVGRSAVQRNERLYRLVKRDRLEVEDVRKIVAEMRGDEGEWKRFVEVVRT